MDNQQIPKMMMEQVINCIRGLARVKELPEHLATAVITTDDTIETLGLDSIGAVSLIERFETELDISLPDDFLDIADDIAGIARRLDAIVNLKTDLASASSGSSQEAIELIRVPT